MTTATTGAAAAGAQTPSQLPGTTPSACLSAVAQVLTRAGELVAEYDQVRTWSDPPARQCEVARLGAAAVELLRQLGPAADGAGGRR